MGKTAEMIIEDDIKKVYLGNLNTVEFDLKLPAKGENGSTITWCSDNELFLKNNGKVTRPVCGIGDRIVHLKGIFKYRGIVKEHIYDVHILEEQAKIKMKEVLPIKRRVPTKTLVVLPQAVVVKADNGHLFSRRVEWEGGNEQSFKENKVYILEGYIKSEQLKATIEIEAMENFREEIKKTSPELNAFDNGETKLLKNSPFYEAMQRDFKYLINIDDDQMLYNFRKASNRSTLGAAAMMGWDSPECMLRGHTTGHYMSALSLCYRETKNEKIKEKLHYVIKELGKCQNEFAKKEGFHEGYIGGYSEEQFDLLEKGEKYPNIWAPYYTLHKILTGFIDAYCYAGEGEALEIAKKVGNWIYKRLSKLSKDRRESMWDTYIAGEFGGMNEAMVRLYKLTGEKRFLETAKMFDNDKLFVPMEEEKDVLEGFHANQHIPQVIGCMELFRETGEKRYYHIAQYFWKIVTEYHRFVNGGVGDVEMFFGPNEESRHLTKDTAEYCVSYNMLKLTKELYEYDLDVKYMDYYERTMFNHILPGFTHETNGETTYFYPLAPGSFKDSKIINSCCHGTGMESQMKYTESIYYHRGDDVYINLFLNSEMEWKERNLKIRQEVDQNNPGKIELTITGGEGCKVKVRKPYWCKTYKIKVNNGNSIANDESDGYISIQRTGTRDVVELLFSCELRIEVTTDSKKTASLAYGPYILAAISDEQSYLEFPEEELLKNIKRDTDADIAFRTDILGKKIVWKPLKGVRKEKHHVYWKIK
nr:beta-L-arabinofuranosidase domain-containing protein [uncultured Sellimonas sp.]